MCHIIVLGHRRLTQVLLDQNHGILFSRGFNPFPCLFQLPWPMTLFLRFQSHRWWLTSLSYRLTLTFLHGHIFLQLLFCLPLPEWRTPVILSGHHDRPDWSLHLKILNLVISAKSFFYCVQWHSHSFWDGDVGIFRGPLFCLPQPFLECLKITLQHSLRMRCLLPPEKLCFISYTKQMVPPGPHPQNYHRGRQWQPTHCGGICFLRGELPSDEQRSRERAVHEMTHSREGLCFPVVCSLLFLRSHPSAKHQSCERYCYLARFFIFKILDPKGGNVCLTFVTYEREREGSQEFLPFGIVLVSLPKRQA